MTGAPSAAANGRGLAILLAALPASAMAFPDEDDWAPLTMGGTEMVDPPADMAEGESGFDIVGEAPHNGCCHWFVDDTHLYFRLLLNASPAPSYLGAWGVLLDTDGDDSAFEAMVTFCLAGYQLHLRRNTAGATGVTASADSLEHYYDQPIDGGFVSVASTITILFGSERDARLDFALPIEDLETYGILTPTTVFRVAAGTSTTTNGDRLDTDFAGRDDSSGLGALSDYLSDQISIDQDGDGLNWFQELEHGTDPTNPDSDGDGLSDGDEVNVYGTDPTNPDTDGGGVDDGTEVLEHGTDPLNPDDDRVDTGDPDTGTPDTGAPDTGEPDTGEPDTGSPDTGEVDTGPPDTGAEHHGGVPGHFGGGCRCSTQPAPGGPWPPQLPALLALIALATCRLRRHRSPNGT